MKKILITSGCSFTFEDWNWQGHLSRNINVPLVNSGMASQGNGLISRKLIYSLNQNLKIYKPEEIIVGVMWSGPERHEFYKHDFRDSLYWGWKNPETMSDSNVKNPTEVVTGLSNWYIVNQHWTNKETVNFYENFQNTFSSMVYTLEHIIRTQLFLEKHNIKYFMSTYMDIFKHDYIMKHEEVKYLYEMIDFSKFLPIKGCHEWVKDNYRYSGGFNDPDEKGLVGIHPTSFGHEKFTDEVIIPFLNKS